MRRLTSILILGLILCIIGFLLALSSLGITIYNYNHNQNEYLRLERIILDTVGQLSFFIGFIVIYYYVFKNIIKMGKW